MKLVSDGKVLASRQDPTSQREEQLLLKQFYASPVVA